MVKRCRKEMKFWGSGSTMKTIDPYKAEQLVVKALDKNPAKRSGLQTIHHRVAFELNPRYGGAELCGSTESPLCMMSCKG